MTVHYGHLLSKTKRRPLAHQPASGPRTVEVLDTEEKGSDVNLASYLLMDGFENDYEMAVVVSNDSDLQLPISMTRTAMMNPGAPRLGPDPFQDWHHAFSLICRLEPRCPPRRLRQGEQ